MQLPVKKYHPTFTVNIQVESLVQQTHVDPILFYEDRVIDAQKIAVAIGAHLIERKLRNGAHPIGFCCCSSIGIGSTGAIPSRPRVGTNTLGIGVEDVWLETFAYPSNFLKNLCQGQLKVGMAFSTYSLGQRPAKLLKKGWIRPH
jgi:hypothetical protein